MNFKQLVTDDRAVSPVIGVILMVAITVILAAVIGTFVLGLGSGLNQAPQSQFDYEYTEDPSSGGYTVNVTHQGGAELTSDAISVTAGGSSATLTNLGPYTAGEVIVNGTSVNAGDSVQVVWSSPDGSSSQIIGESTAPSQTVTTTDSTAG